MGPVSVCSTIMPPDTAGMLRSDQADPHGATAMMSPGFNAANAVPPLPRTGIVALPRGRSPVLPLAQTTRAVPPYTPATIAACHIRQHLGPGKYGSAKLTPGDCGLPKTK